MSTQPAGAVNAAATVTTRSARRLTRSITATWWYTVAGVMFFQLMLLFVWVVVLYQAEFSPTVIQFVGIGGLVWCVATLPLLLDYRHRADTAPLLIWRRHLAPLLISVVFGVASGLLTGIWVMGVLPIVQTLMLLNWHAGIRVRVALVVTLLLASISIVDTRSVLAAGHDGQGTNWWMLVVYTCLCPILTVLSLWWWDVLIALDRARTSEARLAATQERLRVATDVHDLQGHHLQVIALQLELAERLMPQDAEAGLAQLRAARMSVGDAQQGTRDLAAQFRSAPLSDEFANAVDLLRAAGTRADATVPADADYAPALTLGPVIRETTTNVLRHGGGEWARLALEYDDGQWRYEISNDIGASVPTGNGAGLDGITRRTAEVGGTLEVQKDATTFTVIVTVPAERVNIA